MWLLSLELLSPYIHGWSKLCFLVNPSVPGALLQPQRLGWGAVQMLFSSSKTQPETMFNQLSGHPLTQTSSQIKLTILFVFHLFLPCSSWAFPTLSCLLRAEPLPLVKMVCKHWILWDTSSCGFQGMCVNVVFSFAGLIPRSPVSEHNRVKNSFPS